MQPSPRLIAHRGLALDVPELSAPALKKAIHSGAKMIEIDLRLSRDGYLVCLHDEDVGNVLDGEGSVRGFTAKDLLTLRFRSDPLEHPILLDEALAITRGRTLLDLELKVEDTDAPADLIHALRSAFERADSDGEILLTSDSPALLQALQESMSKYPRGYILRMGDDADPFEILNRIDGAVLVCHADRLDTALLESARRNMVAVFAYSVDDPGEVARLHGLGVTGVITNRIDLLTEYFQQGQDRSRIVSHGGGILSLEIGSSQMRAALVSPSGEVLELESSPLPLINSETGHWELDPLQVLNGLRELIRRVAEKAQATPASATLACQRSTGLVCRASDLTPVGPALSWMDARNAGLLDALMPEKEEIEDASGLPLDAAWTAVKGRVIKNGDYLSEDEVLAPLGSWIVSRLTTCPLMVDPTIANRTGLLDRSGLGWNPILTSAYGYTADQLPQLVPTRHDFGVMPWPNGDEVPVEVLIGDQQATYLGALGPGGRALLLILGMGAFAMRGASADAPQLPGTRRAPLFWRGRSPAPRRFLLEWPVLTPSTTVGRDGGLGDVRAYARALALGEEWPRDEAREIRAALLKLADPGDCRVIIAGKGAASPQRLHILREELPWAVECPRPRELGLMGAARMTVFSW